MISILGNIKMPHDPTAGMTGHNNDVSGSAAAVLSTSSTSSTHPDNISKENFDSYFSKLQTICTENMSNDEVKPVCDSKSSHQHQQQQQQQQQQQPHPSSHHHGFPPATASAAAAASSGAATAMPMWKKKREKDVVFQITEPSEWGKSIIAKQESWKGSKENWGPGRGRWGWLLCLLLLLTQQQWSGNEGDLRNFKLVFPSLFFFRHRVLCDDPADFSVYLNLQQAPQPPRRWDTTPKDYLYRAEFISVLKNQ